MQFGELNPIVKSIVLVQLSTVQNCIVFTRTEFCTVTSNTDPKQPSSMLTASRDTIRHKGPWKESNLAGSATSAFSGAAL